MANRLADSLSPYLRQHADIHAAVVSELFARAGLEEYAALEEAARVRVLLRELSTPRLLYSPYLAYSEQTEKELAIFREAARIQRDYREMFNPSSPAWRTKVIADSRALLARAMAQYATVQP